MKKIMLVSLAAVMAMSLSTTAFASAPADNHLDITPPGVEASTRYVGTQTTHSYDYVLGKPTEKTDTKWTHFYTGDPAQREGEVDSAQHSVSYGHSITGGIVGTIKQKIQVELSISLNKSETFGISKNSAPLKKGEYIKAFWARNYEIYDVKQTDHQHIYGFEQQGYGGPYVKVDRYKDVVTKGTVKKALQPKLRIEYWKNNKKVRSAGTADVLDRIEYYELVNGEYQLVYMEMT